jgi:hypothetical protein
MFSPGENQKSEPLNLPEIRKFVPCFLWNFTCQHGSELTNDLPGSIFALC